VSNRIPLIWALLAGLSMPAAGRAQVAFNFATSNGGMTATQWAGTNTVGAWVYGTTLPSVGGTATWATPGVAAGGAAAYALTTPTLTVQANGQVTGSFTHRFSFETNFDGSALLFSVNGGSFNKVPVGLLTGQVYNGGPGAGNPITVLPGGVFTGTSSGYGTPAYVSTGFTLGTGAAQSFVAGDHVQFQFLAGFDANTIGASPNWQIATLDFTNMALVPVPEPGSLAFILGAFGVVAVRRLRRASTKRETVLPRSQAVQQFRMSNPA